MGATSRPNLTDRAFQGNVPGSWSTRISGLTFERHLSGQANFRYQKQRKKFGLTINTELAASRWHSLGDALAFFDQCNQDISNGIDPFKMDARRRMDTFRANAEAWLPVKLAELKPSALKSHNNYKRYVRYMVKEFGEKPISDINQHDVGTLLKKYLGTPTQADRMRGALEAILDRYHVPNNTRNPAEAKVQKLFVGNLRKLAKKKSRNYAAMKVEDAPRFYRTIRDETGLAYRVLELYCLTLGSRLTGALNADWSHVDLNKQTWLVPKENHKIANWRTHLCASAIDSLHRVASPDTPRRGFIYATQSSLSGHLSDTRVRSVWKRHSPSGMDGEATTDIMGFRATFYSWGIDEGLNTDHLTQQRGAKPNVDEASLTYIRTDAYEARKRIITKWEDFLLNG